MKIKLFYYVQNNGDGSATPWFFSTKQKRDRYAELEEEYGEAYCEADGDIEIEIGPDGKIIGGGHLLDAKHYKEEE